MEVLIVWLYNIQGNEREVLLGVNLAKKPTKPEWRQELDLTGKRFY